MSYKDKVVAITGGTDGIGRALVDYFLSHEAKVSTCSRTHDKLYNLVTEYAGKPLHTLVTDVSKEQDCIRFINSTIDTFGDIDILINNAGISMRSLVEDADTEILEKVMGVNFFGSIYCTKAAIASVKNTKGIIVGVSSIAGYRGLPGRSAYSASKHALNGWLEALKIELKHYGVHVMWVAPGFVKSNIRSSALNKEGEKTNNSTLEEDKLMTPEQCAIIIGNAILKRKRSVTMTFMGKMIIFLNRFLPKMADKRVEKFYFKDGELIK
jgi:short-subunit dehydrogenase